MVCRWPIAVALVGCVLAGCRSDEASPAPSDSDNSDHQALSRAPGLALKLRPQLEVRPRYPLGAVPWARLRLNPPEGLGTGESWRLRIGAVRARVDGHDLPPRPWTAEWRLTGPQEHTLDLGTFLGSAGSSEGAHPLALRFEATLYAGNAPQPVWKGELESGSVSLVFAAIRPQDALQAITDPTQEPWPGLRLELRAGGRRIDLLPRQAEEPTLQRLPVFDRASLAVSSDRPLAVGLAFAARLERAEAPEPPLATGSLSVAAGQVGPEPTVCGELEFLAPLPAQEARLVLRLTPSPELALRLPSITRFWDVPPPPLSFILKPVPVVSPEPPTGPIP